MTGTKRCTLCGQTKPLEDFHSAGDRPDGRHSRCAACRNAIERRAIQDQNRPKRKTFPQLKDKTWMEQKYLVECLSNGEIAALVGCTYSIVSKALSTHQIPTRPHGVQRMLRAGREAREKVKV